VPLEHPQKGLRPLLAPAEPSSERYGALSRG